MEVYAQTGNPKRAQGAAPASPQLFNALLLNGLRRFVPIGAGIYLALAVAAYLFRPPLESGWLTVLALTTSVLCFAVWMGVRSRRLAGRHAHAATVAILISVLAYELARSFLERQTQLSSGLIVLLVVAGYVLLESRVLACFLTLAAFGSIAVGSASGAVVSPSEFLLTLLGMLFIAVAVHRLRRKGLEETLAMRREDELRQKELAESEERYALAVRGAKDGLWDWRLDSQEMYFSPRWKHLLGFAEDELRNAPDTWFERMHPDDRVRVETMLDRHLTGESQHFESRHRLRTNRGRYRWMLARGLAVRDASGKATRIAGSLTDIHRLKKVEQRLRRDATHDRLTALPNRKVLRTRLNEAVEGLDGSAENAFAVVFVDVDRFKSVNDTYGHLAGDELLKEVSARLRRQVRPADTVARLGGDEFVVVLRGVADAEQAGGVAERISKTLAAPAELSVGKIPTSACVGFVFAGEASETADEWLRRADAAMYQAKAAGPGSVAQYAEADAASGVQALARAVEGKGASAGMTVR